MKLFFLDAYALIYRAYYALIKTPRISSKGLNTSAIFGFVNTLEEILKKENPTHIGIAFDPSGPTFRHEAFEAYKAQREATPEVIRESVPIIKEITKAYNIPILEVPMYEADDVIGTLAKKASKEFEVYMMTPDKDYGQLVASNIFIYKPAFRGNEFTIIGIEEVKERYGLKYPKQMIDLLALMGDASDNIPGCPGVGEVTAKKLIAEFDTVENLLNRTRELKGALRQKVEENKDSIVFSKFLATIKTDVPIDFDPDSLKREPIDEIALRKIFDELEFRQLASRIFGSTPKVSATVSPILNRQTSLFDDIPGDENIFASYLSGDSINTIKPNYRILDSDIDILDFLEKVELKRSLAFDTETTGIDPLQADLVGMSFALEPEEAYYVPIPSDWEKAKQITNRFKEILESPTIQKIGQNIKFDMNVLKKYGVRIQGPLFDTLIAHYLINPEYRHNLNYLAETYLNYRTIHIEDLIGTKGKNQLNMRDVPLTKIVDYACEDADITLKLKLVFEKMIEENNLSNLFYEIEMPLVPVLADMEETGVRLDVNVLKQSSKGLTEHLFRMEKDIYEMAGIEFNIASPKMVGEILFDRLKIIEKAKKTKTGQYTTSEEVLESMKSKHPIVGKILEYRKLKKLLSTYVDALPALISPTDHKVHTTYNQAVTATGRLSSTNPNLQNIPIRDDEGKEIRRAFIPNDSCLFFSADYSQIELRIMAHLSQDANMIEAFREGQDIHQITAAKIYGVPVEEVTRDMRRNAKTANFGIIYGISVFGLSEQLHIPRSEAKELIDGYFKTFPGIKPYMDKSIELAKEKEYVETIFHRKRFLPDINSRNSVVRAYAERNAINAPIQGSAADIIKVAMNNIYRRFREEDLQSEMIMQVHDELNFNVVTSEIDRVREIVIEEMEGAAILSVPIVADCGIGKNWLEAH